MKFVSGVLSWSTSAPPALKPYFDCEIWTTESTCANPIRSCAMTRPYEPPLPTLRTWGSPEPYVRASGAPRAEEPSILC